jgi:glycerol-3-phosphate acyltransferase PlsX
MQATGFNFVGNVEGRDVFRGSVDVIVCDGFVGNVLLKSAESLAGLMSGMMKEELSKSWRSRLGYSLARPAFESFRRRVDYREYGAAPLLGVEAGCFIGHGRSNSIRRAVEFCEADLHNKIRDRVAELHDQEERLLKTGLAEEMTAN